MKKFLIYAGIFLAACAASLGAGFLTGHIVAKLAGWA